MKMQATKISEAVEYLMKNPIQHPEVVKNKLHLIFASIDQIEIKNLSFDQIFIESENLLKLLDIESKLPNQLRKRLWNLYLARQKYLCLKKQFE